MMQTKLNTKNNQKQTVEDLEKLRAQIDYLEEKIRQAEKASVSKLEQADPLQTIYKWESPERLHTKKNKTWYTIVYFFTSIIVAYSALTHNYLLILALIMLLVLLYALDSFPPKMITHEILNQGIKTMNKIYSWDRIVEFWVTERSGQYVLNFTLLDEQVPRMIILAGKGDINKIVRELVLRIDYKNPGGTKQDIFSRITEGKHLPVTQFLDVFAESQKLEQKQTIKPQPNEKLSKKI